MDYDESAWAHLAEVATARRDYHGWTQAEVATRGGISLDTVQSIEGARRTGYRARTLRGYERGMLWASHSVTAVLEGREPTPLEGEPLPRTVMTPIPSGDSPAQAIGQALEMLRAVRGAFGQVIFDAALAQLRAESGGEAHGASGSR
ncbi:helix-turn-helix domain-containing protein [Saccharothrix lopnurensis]|uniref:Helix-turn-helix domain-containing protein n=1 Tax=Saccharothrix lopnurensis TaxID=1670621 RepID=A0ABW1P1S3_9PSEU